jgi:hypothetical protein
MVRSAQTAHLSCFKISIISKWTQIGFHLSLVTWKYRRVRPTRFLSRRYIRHKPHNYLASISKRTRTSFHLSLDIYEYRWVCPKQFLSLWYVWHKPCTYIAPTLTLSPNETKRDSTRPTHLGVPSSASKTISEPMVRSTQTTHISCSRLALSPNGLEQPST